MTTLNQYVTDVHVTAKLKGWWSDEEKQANKVLTVLDQFLDKETLGKVAGDIVHALTKEGVVRGRSPLDIYALVTSEISEAVEEARKGNPPVYAVQNGTKVTNLEEIKRLNLKPEGEAVELADAFIRIADWFGKNDWNLEEVVNLKMNYNNTRSYRHGNKKF